MRLGLIIITPETAEQQRQLFERHLSAGRQFNLPVVVHIRDAFDDAFELLEANLGDAGGIVHCFTGGVKECTRALELGMYISFRASRRLRMRRPYVKPFQ